MARHAVNSSAHVGIILIFFACLPSFLNAQTGKRVALVIGNGGYRFAPLATPLNDAKDIGQALTQVGFATVLVRTDLSKRGIAEAVDEFCRAAVGADAAVFFYSGHGAQSGGQNYILPVDKDSWAEADLEYEAYPVGRVLAGLEDSGVKARIVILDACRNVPIARKTMSAAQGLVNQQIPKGSVVLYATGAGLTAEAGTARNSVFTTALKRHLADAGSSLMDMFGAVTEEVAAATGGKQVPSANTQLVGRFYFASPPVQPDSDTGVLTVQKIPGSIQVEVKARGRVFVDGEDKGELSAGGIGTISGVQAGSRTVEVRYADGESERYTVIVERDKTASVAFSHVERPNAPTNMIFVQGGAFTMGSPPNESGRDSDEVQHQVSVGGFSLAKYETTVAEFKAFTQATGYKTSSEIRGKAYVVENNSWTEKTGASWRNPGFTQGDNEPVVCVSWCDAVAYCNWKSAQEGRKAAYNYSGKGTDYMIWPSGWNTETHNNIQWDRTSNGYRLPTEAEWEYAARASGSGPQTTVWAGSNNVDEVGWYSGNSGNRTHPVGQKKANGVGLYDMSGNVWEWCWDWYGGYNTGVQTDPAGSSSGAYRVARGGGWIGGASYLRVAYRGDVDPWRARTNGGFRLCVPSVR